MAAKSMRLAVMESMPNMVPGLIATEAYTLVVIPDDCPFGPKRVGFSDGFKFADEVQRKGAAICAVKFFT
jgi:hypothetical protein